MTPKVYSISNSYANLRNTNLSFLNRGQALMGYGVLNLWIFQIVQLLSKMKIGLFYNLNQAISGTHINILI